MSQGPSNESTERARQWLAHETLDPMHDALGKLVLACQGLEMWLHIATARLTEGDYVQRARRLKPKGALQLLEDAAQDLPTETRADLLDVVARARNAIETRNALVHGMWQANEDGTAFVAERPHPGAKSHEEPYLRTRFDRVSVLAAAFDARSCFGPLQTRSWFAEDGIERR